MAKPVDIFGFLRRKEEVREADGRRYRARMTIEFKAPDLVFSADENAIAQDVATAIQEQIRENMLAGRTPSGDPMPAPDPDTVERREARDKQARRGGQPSRRYLDSDDPKFARKVLRNWNKRFKAPRLGWFSPKDFGNSRFGLESGMLASSVKAVPEGGRWVVYFAGPRAIVTKIGTSAVGRVFKKIAPWSRQAMQQPAIQQALKRVADNLWVSRLSRLFSELSQTAQNVQDIAEEAGAE